MAATSWPEKRAEFQQRHEAISQYAQNKLPQDLQDLAKALANYVEKGGVAQDPNQDGDFKAIQTISARINQNKQGFSQLNQEIAGTLQTLGSDNDMGLLLMENGVLQQTIIALEKETDTVTQDEKAAIARDELLRGRDTLVTKHQLFMLGRPLRPSSIPILWALSVLFIGIGVLVLQVLFPLTPAALGMSADGSAEGIVVSVLTFLSNPWVWGTLFGASIIVILFLSLKIAGYFH
jgi:hypothetical protein